jgi:hypothetical protein
MDCDSLSLDLDAGEEQIEFPVVYTNAKVGWRSSSSARTSAWRSHQASCACARPGELRSPPAPPSARAIVRAMERSPLRLIEFPADDPERALGLGRGLEVRGRERARDRRPPARTRPRRHLLASLFRGRKHGARPRIRDRTGRNGRSPRGVMGRLQGLRGHAVRACDQDGLTCPSPPRSPALARERAGEREAGGSLNPAAQLPEGPRRERLSGARSVRGAAPRGRPSLRFRSRSAQSPV